MQADDQRRGCLKVRSVQYKACVEVESFFQIPGVNFEEMLSHWVGTMSLRSLLANASSVNLVIYLAIAERIYSQQ